MINIEGNLFIYFVFIVIIL